MPSISDIFDAYSLKARLFPALLTLTPIYSFLLVSMPEIKGLVFALVGTPPMAMLVASFARNRGKAKEIKLWEQAGGNPIVRFLRHRDCTLSSIVKQNHHTAASNLFGRELPSAASEREDPKSADEIYDFIGHKLRTRDHANKEGRDKLLFSRNVEYGFARNCFGLRTLAILLSIASCVALSWQGVVPIFTCDFSELMKLPLANVIAIIFIGSVMCMWIFYITEKFVESASDAYALRLLELLEEHD